MARRESAPSDLLCMIQSSLNARRTRTIDLFRGMDDSMDGSVTGEELRVGLSAFGVSLSDGELRDLLLHVDKDGSGEVNVRELDRALKAAERDKKGSAPSRSSKGVAALTSGSSTLKSVMAGIVASPQASRQAPAAAGSRLPPASPRQEPSLEPMSRADEVMCGIRAKLNRRKTRMIDVFRVLDQSGDGCLSPKELSAGLARLGCELNNEDFAVVVDTLDKDGSGDISIAEFDKALKLAEKKARTEGKEFLVSTWMATKDMSQFEYGRYDWSRRCIATNSSTGSPLASQARSSGASTWHCAAAGPAERALFSKVGSGSLHDASMTRSRLFDGYHLAPGHSTPRAVPPRMPSPRSTPQNISTHGYLVDGPVLKGRFATEPAVLPSRRMLTSREWCPSARRACAQPRFDGGARKFPNAPTMQSTVDQVVFNHDIDFSGNDKIDQDFSAMFEGMAGMPSWHYSRE